MSRATQRQREKTVADQLFHLSTKVASLQQQVKAIDEVQNAMATRLNVNSISVQKMQAERRENLSQVESLGRSDVPGTNQQTVGRSSMEVVANTNCNLHGHQIGLLVEKVTYNREMDLDKQAILYTTERTTKLCLKCGHLLEEIRGEK